MKGDRLTVVLQPSEIERALVEYVLDEECFGCNDPFSDGAINAYFVDVEVVGRVE